MSKPLELVVFEHVNYQRVPGVREPHPDWFFDAEGNAQEIRYLYQPAKRLTDPELAAEHWLLCWFWERNRAEVGEDDPSTDRIQQMAETACRFATHPHYDEEQP